MTFFTDLNNLVVKKEGVEVVSRSSQSIASWLKVGMPWHQQTSHPFPFLFFAILIMMRQLINLPVLGKYNCNNRRVQENEGHYWRVNQNKSVERLTVKWKRYCNILLDNHQSSTRMVPEGSQWNKCNVPVELAESSCYRRCHCPNGAGDCSVLSRSSSLCRRGAPHYNWKRSSRQCGTWTTISLLPSYLLSQLNLRVSNVR